MTNVLAMQASEVETPEQEKASMVSVRWCRNSYVSVVLCIKK
ncbi:hypothetical protein EDD41_2037 [Luteococcus japonicus]|uniref:Uncharacterized protein n=2 Tax=Luteococcus japonicus TaxID=33984 RepID=A0A1R4J7V4_9ACTN|nr:MULTISPECIES: hypothetical protein [Luteococcus]ROR54806.1 hypothetical protein EDD41_2037 [Luteococcus japonicus]SJN28039.1 hypothetical protein FM114_05925 [Luteococcus japonicus LSP_Lj1]